MNETWSVLLFSAATTTTTSTTGMAGWLVRICRPFHVSNPEPNRTSGGVDLDLDQ